MSENRHKRENLATLKLKLEEVYNLADKTSIEDIKTIHYGFHKGKQLALREFKKGRARIFEEFETKSASILGEMKQKELEDAGWGVF